MKSIYLKPGEKLLSSYVPRFQTTNQYGGLVSNLLIIKRQPFKYRRYSVHVNGSWIGTFRTLKDAQSHALTTYFSIMPSAARERAFVIYSK
jgi:hypothetical protein